MAEKHYKDKPFTMKQLSEIYESAMPDLLRERDRHLSLMQGRLDDTPQSWFPEWSEADAEYSYEIAVHLREYFDPELKQAFRWATVFERVNPEARRLLNLLHNVHSHILEILWEWKDMCLLSYSIVRWNLCVERLIDLWLDSKGLIEGG